MTRADKADRAPAHEPAAVAASGLDEMLSAAGVDIGEAKAALARLKAAYPKDVECNWLVQWAAGMSHQSNALWMAVGRAWLKGA